MRLRTILLVLSLLASISTAVGGFYYFFSLREREFNKASWRAAARTEVIRDQLGSYLAGNLKSVRALAGLDEIGSALERPEGERLARANRRLDHFKESLEVDVCYLMDSRGLVLASSNRHDPDSFVGDNYGFRPYFKEALTGKAGKYLALGLTSKKRGAYYSYPVRVGDNGRIVGVAVIKAPIRIMEREVINSFEGITLLTGPHDIIFSSNRPQWLFGALWRKTPWQTAQVAESRQFGKGPWEWIGFTRKSSTLAVNETGELFLIFSLELTGYLGWNVVHLENLQPAGAAVLSPLAKTTGLAVILLCLLAGGSVYYLHRKAGLAIDRRAAVEEDLRLTQEKLEHYSRDLERQVRERTLEITSFLTYTPALVYMKDCQGKYTMVNPRWEDLFGLTDAQVKGKSVYEVFSPETADIFWGNDLLVLNSRLPRQAEERFSLESGVYNYLSVRFPILDEAGDVTRLCGISVDITDLKKAQDRLRKLSGGIINSQENERTAIARELHDELGQVLTALRMDAVWLRDRLGSTDGKAASRAMNMCDLIDKTISDVRHIATRLRPPVLDDLGLGDALEWYTSEYEKRTGLVCVFSRAALPPLDKSRAITVFRVVQEALTNAARHSEASHVEVALRLEDDALEVRVEDNGRGFDPEAESDRDSLGLAGMRERALLAGGELRIISGPGQGAVVLLRIPLRNRYGEVA